MSEQYQQMNLFNFGKDYFKIDKPIRLIELFSGIGAQAKALEILGVPFEHWKTCEWAVNSIKSYNAIHIKDYADYSKDLTKEQLIEYLDGNISTNYNEPCNVKRQNEKWLRDVYNNCIATHNLMNIMKVKGSDLEIVDTDKYCYIMTYSFPCQDLSLAGQRKGMETSQADGGTRSGLLWECERLLDELEHKPHVLLMENVPEVIGTGNVKHFHKWLYKLESLGYTNFVEIINAKDFQIPQNRRRCFMVSILGDFAYDFPYKHKAKYCLKDFLEKNVPEKYFLDSKDIERISSWNAYEKPLDNVLDVNDGDDVISTITTHVGKDSAGMKLIRYSDKSLERIKNNIVEDDTSPCITANAMQSINHQNCVLIKENTKKGYKIAKDGDGVNLASRMAHQRGNVQHKSIQTLKTEMEIGVVVEEKNLKQELCDKLIEEGKVQEMQVIRHSYTNNRLKGGKPIDTVQSVDTNVSPTLDTRCDCLGVVVDGNYGNGHHAKNIYNEKGIAPTITTGNHGLGTAIKTEDESAFTDLEKELFTKDGNINRYIGSEKVDEFKEGQMATTTFPNGYGHGPRTHNESIALNTIDRPSVKQNLRIRKLVPCETLKLMGFEKKDYLALRDIGMSDAAIYHCSGDSIVVTCLMALFGQMMSFSEKELKHIIDEYAKSIVES